ncbi:eCIS core domain-containing protein [Pantanalinema sp. GBBB05]|uniref:eCIS core domain-containing protein n=1 Tax=Pantanalinema sp. GBBB05 TaxID=2604139 RepID=UPI003D81A1E0
MGTRSHGQAKSPSESSATPPQTTLQPHSFNQPAPAESVPTLEDLHIQLEQAQRGGHHLSNFAAAQPEPPPPNIQTKLAIGAPGDKYEQEADRVAQQVVQQIKVPKFDRPQSGQVVQQEPIAKHHDLQLKPVLQREDEQEEDELQRSMYPGERLLTTSESLGMSQFHPEVPQKTYDLQLKPMPQAECLAKASEASQWAAQLADTMVQTQIESLAVGDRPHSTDLQMKPLPTSLQREAIDEEEELQMKPARSRGVMVGDASTDLESAINSARGSGQPLDPGLQQQMGQAMGADFRGVTVHTDATADRLNQSIQAKAFTTGQDIFFRGGAYNPGSRDGQELIAHELTHVVQQQQSKIQRQDTALETAKKRHIADIDESQKDRRGKLDGAFKEKNFFGMKSVSFKKVADLLYGLVGLEQKEKEALNQNIKKTFGDGSWKTKYLASIVEKGQPSRTMKLALAIGLVTGDSGDKKEALRIIEEKEWETNDQKEYKDNKKAIEDKIRSTFNLETLRQIENFFAAKENPVLAKEINYLVSIINQRYHLAQKTNVTKLIDGVKGWIAKVSPQTRQQTKGNKEVNNALDRLELKQWDKDYLIALISGNSVNLKTVNLNKEDVDKPEEAWKLEQEFLTEDKKKESQDTQKKASNFAAVNDLHALLTREISKFKGVFSDRQRRKGILGRGQYKHTKLTTQIAAMSGEQKKLFLETSPLDELEKKLQEAGFEEKDVADIKKQFSVANTTPDQELGSNYRDLVKLIGDPGEFKSSSFPKKAFSIIARLTQDELYQVRSDADVWKNLKNKCEKGDKGPSILGVFGLSKWSDELKKDGNEKDNKGEYNPSHWATLINYAIDKHTNIAGDVNLLTIKSGHLAELMQHAQTAGKKVVASQNLNKGFKEFTDKVWQDVTDRHKAYLKGSSRREAVHYLKELSLKFEGGTEIKAEDRIDLAMRWGKTHEQEITRIIEDSSGEQLKGLSNFDDFSGKWKIRGDGYNELSALQKELKKAKENSDQKAITDKEKGIQAKNDEIKKNNKEIDNFIIDLKPNILNKLEQELGDLVLTPTGDKRNKTLVGVVSKARRKLAEALSKDKEVFKLDGLTESEKKVMQERIRALALLDEEDLSRKGIQWSSLSVTSLEQQESAWAYKGAHRAMSHELEKNHSKDGGFRFTGEDKEDRNKIIETRVTEIQTAEGEWKTRKDAFEALKAKYDGRVKLIVDMVLGAVLGVVTGFLTGGASWLVGALIKFSMALAQKTLSAGVSYALTGEGMTRAQLGQLVAQTLVEGGLAVASAAFTEHVTNPNWAKATLVGDDSKLGQSWYKQGGIFTSKGVASEAGKTAAEGMVSKILFEAPATLYQDLATKEEVLKELRHDPGKTMGSYFVDMGRDAILTFVKTTLGETIKDQWTEKSKRQDEGRLRKDWHDKIEAEKSTKQAQDLLNLTPEQIVKVDSEAAKAQNQLNTAQASVAQAQTEAERATATASVRQAQDQLNTAQASVTQAQDQLNTAQASVTQAQDQLNAANQNKTTVEKYRQAVQDTALSKDAVDKLTASPQYDWSKQNENQNRGLNEAFRSTFEPRQLGDTAADKGKDIAIDAAASPVKQEKFAIADIKVSEAMNWTSSQAPSEKAQYGKSKFDAQMKKKIFENAMKHKNISDFSTFKNEFTSAVNTELKQKKSKLENDIKVIQEAKDKDSNIDSIGEFFNKLEQQRSKLESQDIKEKEIEDIQQKIKTFDNETKKIDEKIKKFNESETDSLKNQIKNLLALVRGDTQGNWNSIQSKYEEAKKEITETIPNEITKTEIKLKESFEKYKKESSENLNNKSSELKKIASDFPENKKEVERYQLAISSKYEELQEKIAKADNTEEWWTSYTEISNTTIQRLTDAEKLLEEANTSLNKNKEKVKSAQGELEKLQEDRGKLTNLAPRDGDFKTQLSNANQFDQIMKSFLEKYKGGFAENTYRDKIEKAKENIDKSK